MNKYNLYGSAGCHLCEQALVICLAEIPAEQLMQVDIVDTEHVEHETKTLVELYGVHIPVLEKLVKDSNPKSDDSNKLFWPFSQAQLSDFVVN